MLCLVCFEDIDKKYQDNISPISGFPVCEDCSSFFDGYTNVNDELPPKKGIYDVILESGIKCRMFYENVDGVSHFLEDDYEHVVFWKHS